MLESIEPWNHKGAHWHVFQQCHETYPRKRHGNHFADWDTLQHIDGNLRSYGYYTRSSKEISTTFLVPRYGESLGAARYKKHRLGTAAPDPFDSSLWWFAHRMHLCPCFVLGQHACRWAQALTVRVRHPYPCWARWSTFGRSWQWADFGYLGFFFPTKNLRFMCSIILSGIIKLCGGKSQTWHRNTHTNNSLSERWEM